MDNFNALYEGLLDKAGSKIEKLGSAIKKQDDIYSKAKRFVKKNVGERIPGLSDLKRANRLLAVLDKEFARLQSETISNIKKLNGLISRLGDLKTKLKETYGKDNKNVNVVVKLIDNKSVNISSFISDLERKTHAINKMKNYENSKAEDVIKVSKGEEPKNKEAEYHKIKPPTKKAAPSKNIALLTNRGWSDEEISNLSTKQIDYVVGLKLTPKEYAAKVKSKNAEVKEEPKEPKASKEIEKPENKISSEERKKLLKLAYSNYAIKQMTPQQAQIIIANNYRHIRGRSVAAAIADIEKIDPAPNKKKAKKKVKAKKTTKDSDLTISDAPYTKMTNDEILDKAGYSKEEIKKMKASEKNKAVSAALEGSLGDKLGYHSMNESLYDQFCEVWDSEFELL